MKRFKKIYIEIGNICNMNCSFCPETKRKGEFMEIDKFSFILDQIKPYTNYIYFHVKGEPLLHPKLGQLLDISYEKGFRVNITTNGTLINKVQNKILTKPALRQINFSLHSFDGNEDSDKKPESKDAYLNNIFQFIKAAQKTGLFISLRLWNLEKDNTINLEKEKNQVLLEMIQKEFGLPYKIEDKILPNRGLQIAQNVYLNQDHEFKWPDLNEAEDDGQGFWHGLRNQVAILVDGTVVPCCLDGEGVINLGNIYDTNFSQIIDSKRAQAIYDGFSKRRAVEELCRKCGYRLKFGDRPQI